MVSVTGTLVWYYYVCKRQVWLISHHIQPAQDNPFLELGRFLHETAYTYERKEIKTDYGVFDVVKKEKGNFVVAEVKKSSKFKYSAKMQLCFYLLGLKRMGIQAKGELRFPKERKREIVELTPEIEEELQKAMGDIISIAEQELPPSPTKNHFCRKCAYREFCWA